MAKTKTDFDKAADKAEKWAAGGKDALNLATKVQAAAMVGETVPATPKNVKTTVQAAIKMFLDGAIDNPAVKAALSDYGLNMDNIRKSLTEQVLARAIPNMIAEGDISALVALAKAAGEDIGQAGQPPAVLVQIAPPDQLAMAKAHVEEYFKQRALTDGKAS